MTQETTSGITFGAAMHELPMSAEAAALGRAAAAAIPWWSESAGMLDPALWWAEHVCSVFPLSEANGNGANPGKVPVYTGGADDPRRHLDLEDVHEWWSVRPWCNIAVTTQANRMLVLDIDPRDGGNASMTKWAESLELDLSDVPRQRSPRGDGGVHLFWRLPDDAPKLRHGPVLDGIDLPWQVPVSPSLRKVEVGRDHQGKAITEFKYYAWVAGDPRALPIVPQVMLDDLVAAQARGRRSSQTSSSGGDGQRTSVLTPVTLDVNVLLETGIPSGQQNNTVLALASSLAGGGRVDALQAAETIWAILQKSPQDQREPWEPQQVVAMVKRAYDYIRQARAAEYAETKSYADRLTAELRRTL